MIQDWIWCNVVEKRRPQKTQLVPGLHNPDLIIVLGGLLIKGNEVAVLFGCHCEGFYTTRRDDHRRINIVMPLSETSMYTAVASFTVRSL